MKLALFASLAILASCHVSAQTSQNITPHDSQPIQPVLVSTNPTGTCTNYAQTFINWQTGAQTVCANGSYLTSTTGGGGGIPYPAAGIPLSTGSAWSGSIAAPSGAIVGTTDPQTLTNKTVDGVAPITFSYLDATSSIQQQINARLTGVGIQSAGGSIGSATTINFSTGLTPSISGNVVTVTASGGGSVGGLLATAASNTSTLTVGTDCSTSSPCILGVGSLSLAKITASMTATAATGTGSNDTAYIYLDTANGNTLTIGDGGIVTLTTPGSGAGSGMVVAGSAITGFPVDSLPLFTVTITSDNFTAVSDQRAIYRAGKRIIAGLNVTVTDAPDSVTIASTGGGSTFNGGTITAPLTISTDGLSANTPLLNMLMSSTTGYNVLQMKDDLSHAWQFGVGGSATSLNGFYMWDGTKSNTFFQVNPTDDGVTFTGLGSAPLSVTSATTNATSLYVNNTSSGGHSWGISSGGSSNNVGRFSWYDATANKIGMRLDTSSAAALAMFDNIQIGVVNGGYAPGTCNKAGMFAWDATTTPASPEVCDGSAWHHLTYKD